VHIYFLVSFAINSLWGDHFEPCHWRNITTSPGPWIDGFSYFNFTIKILYIYICVYVCMYIAERERERERYIYIGYIGYIGYRICVAARVFVWKEEITFLDILGGFSSHGHGIVEPEGTAVVLPDCTLAPAWKRPWSQVAVRKHGARRRRNGCTWPGATGDGAMGSKPWYGNLGSL